MTRLGVILFAAVFAGAFSLGAVSFGCHAESDRPRSTTRLTEPEDVLNEPLMLALAQAKNFHHKADVYLEMGDVDAAIAEIRNVLAVPFPAGAPEAADVLADARARLAKLLAGRGDYEQALRVIDEGIAASPRESFFLANLHTVRGEVLEAKAKALEGEPREVMLRDALESYDRSLQMNTRIQKRLMQELGQ